MKMCLDKSRLFAGGILAFQLGIDRWMGADLVVPFVGPLQNRKVMRIDLRHAAAANRDFTEDIVADGH